MRKSILIGSTIILLSGCNSLGIIFSKKTQPTDAGNERVAVVSFNPQLDEEPNTDKNWTKLIHDPDKNYEKMCQPKAESLTPLATSAVVALGGVAWDLGVDAINSKIDEIKERSSKVWSATWTVDQSTLKQQGCIALVRYKANGTDITDPQMVILLQLRDFESNKAFQIVPLYVFSRTSRALTKDEGDDIGHIALSIAVAQSAFVGTEIKDIGSDVITIGGVKVKENGETNEGYRLDIAMVKNENGDMLSDQNSAIAGKPILYPDGSSYLKFAVTETGTLSGDDAKAKAEIKAITDALGPVAKEALKKKFIDENDGK